MRSSFSRLLRKLRLRKGLSQERLGVLVRPDVSSYTALNYVNRLETGKLKPLRCDVELLAEALDVSREQLLDAVNGDFGKRRNYIAEKIEQPSLDKRDLIPGIHHRSLQDMNPDRLARAVNKILAKDAKYVGGG